MKPLLVLARITFVGCLWSIIFIEGIRVIVLENWRFDIFWPAHWAYAWNLWQAGWVIDTPKEWAFILILLAFIPLWLTGWVALSLVPWENLICRVVAWPLKFIKGSVEPLAQTSSATPIVVKKKSYKEVRPAGTRMPISDYEAPSPAPQMVVQPEIQQTNTSHPLNPVKEKAVTARETLNHTIFDLDDDDEDFDLDIDSFDKADIFKIDTNKKEKKASSDNNYPMRSETKKSKPRFDFDDEDDDLETYEPVSRNSRTRSREDRRREDFDDEREYRKERRTNRAPERERQSRREEKEISEKPRQTSRGSIGDLLEDRGYDVLRNISFKKTLIDYVAIDQEKILLCIVDKEPGDWLADEERFNDEEPLWFSENSHRISPVRKADLARQKFEELLEDSDLSFEIKPYVVIVSGNIINAEDMLDIWSDMNITVSRFAKGSPSDLPALSKSVEQAEEKLSRNEMAEFKKLIKKLV